MLGHLHGFRVESMRRLVINGILRSLGEVVPARISPEK